MRKYNKGKKIKNIAGFDKSECSFFMVHNRTTHRSWIESMQYRTIQQLIKKGVVFEAVYMGANNENGNKK